MTPRNTTRMKRSVTTIFITQIFDPDGFRKPKKKHDPRIHTFLEGKFRSEFILS